MKEYEVKVIEEKIVYVEADSENEAIETAKLEAILEEPETIKCRILSSIDLDDEDVTICGEHGCDGCIFQHRGDIETCKQETARRK